MAETEVSRKRFRDEEPETAQESDTKRYCSFNNILSLLESDEEEPTQDLSSLISTLQHEISSSSSSEPSSGPLPEPDPGLGSLHLPESPSLLKEDEGDLVIRHLLEASDDELGIPNQESVGVGEEDESRRFEEISNYACFWEIEDETANYYALLQSDLFLS